MNSILVCLFVFTLGSLAAKIPADVGRNPESLQKRSSELQDSSLIPREHNSDRWRKMNFSPVCFGAKNHQFGRFFVHSVSGEKLAAVKLVHLYGYVTCYTPKVSYWSYWGCQGTSFYAAENINVVITTATNRVLLPPAEFIIHHATKFSKLPVYTSISPELVLSFFSPYAVQSGEELRLWYGEDLTNTYQGDNGGTACVDIYALYV